MKRIFLFKRSLIGYVALLVMLLPGYILAISNYTGRLLELLFIALLVMLLPAFIVIGCEYLIIKLWVEKSKEYKKIALVSKLEKKIMICFFIGLQLSGLVILYVRKDVSILIVLVVSYFLIIGIKREELYISRDYIIYNLHKIEMQSIERLKETSSNNIMVYLKNGNTYMIRSKISRVGYELERLIYSIQKNNYRDQIIKGKRLK